MSETVAITEVGAGDWIRHESLPYQIHVKGRPASDGTIRIGLLRKDKRPVELFYQPTETVERVAVWPVLP